MARHNALSDETKQAIALDYLAGMSQSKIAEKHGINASTVCKLVSKMKMSEIKEKEPAAAATATDSDVKTLQVQDTTSTAECQALEAARKKLLAIYETLSPEECRAWELGEVYAEVVRGLGE